MITALQAVIAVIVVFGSLLCGLTSPFIGIAIYHWINFTLPFHLIYSLFTIPLLQLALAVTLVGFIVSQDRGRIFFNNTILCFGILWFWTVLTTLSALVPESAGAQLFDFTQIFCVSLLTAFILDSKKKVHYLVWTVVAAFLPHALELGLVGFITPGAKTGGGMEGTFYEAENSYARMIIMTMPLMFYCFLQTKLRYVQISILVAMGISTVSVVVTGSRGGFVAMAAMGAYFWLISRRKLRIALYAGVALIGLFSALPEARREAWLGRMETVETRDEDASYNQRLRFWAWATDMANSRPIFGGGFGVFELNIDLMGKKEVARPAHSSYFEMLASHGYVGLALYCLLGVSAFWSSLTAIRRASHVPSLYWARDLMLCCQMFLVAYFVGGITANQGIYMPYYLIVGIIAATSKIVADEFKQTRPDAAVQSVGMRPVAASLRKR